MFQETWARRGRAAVPHPAALPARMSRTRRVRSLTVPGTPAQGRDSRLVLVPPCVATRRPSTDGMQRMRVASLSLSSFSPAFQDINAYNGEAPTEKLPFPIIDDKNRDLAILLGMLDPAEKDEKGMPLTARVVSCERPPCSRDKWTREPLGGNEGFLSN